MSKMVKATKEQRENEVNKLPDNAVTNFMGGVSYKLNPIETLKLVSASSIFGEPQYYRNGEFAEKTIPDATFHLDKFYKEYFLSIYDEFNGKKTSDIMEKIIDEALSFDFKATLEWAVELRTDFLMRLNPQVIMVRAAIHPDREKFTKEYPSLFAEINAKVMARADEPASQLTYYLYKNGKKNNVPGLLKRSWAKKYSSMKAYDIYKYRNSGIGMIDTVRVCHANSTLINELMKTGTVTIEENNKTWEALRAQGHDWKYILENINMGHMALLRNLRGIFTEIDDFETTEKVLEKLKNGVLKGKQFPFRYMSAYNAVKSSLVNNKQMILDALQDCLDISCDNMPKLKGKTMCLSDNSGSAWSGFTSEYGTVTVANIDNLSSLITTRNSEQGYVGIFGDRLIVKQTSKRDGILKQEEELSKKAKQEVGQATENGIWIFFRDAIENKEHWDNIFIYSDMQAGHGGLYGTPKGKTEYMKNYGAPDDKTYIDVAKLINDYRKKVNPKVNVYCVQTAGYENVLIPENGYRTSILTGWTGKELLYSDKINKFWDEYDKNH